MVREDALKVAESFTTALARRDREALLGLFRGDARYTDPSRPGVSQGSQAVGEHLGALCDSLAGATITPLDVIVDHDSACVRWMAELPEPRGHALDAVTWLELTAEGISEARSYFDAGVFFTPPSALDEAAPPATAEAHGLGAPVVLRGSDSRGVLFNLESLRGRVVCLLAASRGVHEDAQRMATTLGDHFGGNPDVLLVFLLDGTDVPRALRPVARSAMATLRAQAVRRFREGFEKRGRPVPRDVEDMVWFVPDYEGTLFAALQISLPLKAAVLAVLDQEGRLRGSYPGPGGEAAHQAAAQCLALLGRA